MSGFVYFWAFIMKFFLLIFLICMALLGLIIAAALYPFPATRGASRAITNAVWQAI